MFPLKHIKHAQHNQRGDNNKKITELVGAAGLRDAGELRPEHINHRVGGGKVMTYAELYEYLPEGCLLSPNRIPQNWQEDWNKAAAHSWELSANLPQIMPFLVTP